MAHCVDPTALGREVPPSAARRGQTRQQWRWLLGSRLRTPLFGIARCGDIANVRHAGEDLVEILDRRTVLFQKTPILSRA
jgi:hypothetical protein